MPTIECRVLYLDHIAERGCDLFRVACERDLEGIVGKWTRGTYQTDGRATSWVKIKNPAYSQASGRSELFEQKRSAETYRSAPGERDALKRRVAALERLKHTSAPLLLTAGVPPQVVQQRRGHEGIEMTLGIYAHVLPSMQQDAAKRLGSLLHG
jgi:integrase